jgi:hypothetical protein
MFTSDFEHANVNAFDTFQQHQTTVVCGCAVVRLCVRALIRFLKGWLETADLRDRAPGARSAAVL